MYVAWVCSVCGRKAMVRQGTPRIYCLCGYVQLGGVRAGLGDRVAAALHRVGITPKRYKKVKRWLGLAPKCKCPERQIALNSAGYQITKGLRQAWLRVSLTFGNVPPVL